jgi:hypothetical protein
MGPIVAIPPAAAMILSQAKMRPTWNSIAVRSALLLARYLIREANQDLWPTVKA